MLLKHALVSAAAILLTACGSPCGRDHARVMSVLDGDTVALEDGRTVRMTGIDAPELSKTPECGAIEARDALATLVLGRNVRLLMTETSCTDRYGRTLARIRVDDADAGLRLISTGRVCPWPDIDTAPPDIAEAAALARDAARGGWASCPLFCASR